MKTFYVLYDDGYYLVQCSPSSWNPNVGMAMQFESLCQALDFKQLHELEISVLKVEITVAYTPNLFTENLLK